MNFGPKSDNLRPFGICVIAFVFTFFPEILKSVKKLVKTLKINKLLFWREKLKLIINEKLVKTLKINKLLISDTYYSLQITFQYEQLFR